MKYIVTLERTTYTVIEARDEDHARARAVAVAKHGLDNAEIRAVGVEAINARSPCTMERTT